MKKYITLCILFGFGLSLHAQDAIIKYFDKYMDEEGFTSVYISPRMFGLFKKEDFKDDEFNNSIKGVKSFRLLAADSATVVKSGNLLGDAQKIMRGKPYESLMSVKKHGEEVQFLVLDSKEEPDHINELLMMVAGDHSFFMLSLTGLFSLEQVSEVSKSLDLPGEEQLEYLKEKNKEKE